MRLRLFLFRIRERVSQEAEDGGQPEQSVSAGNGTEAGRESGGSEERRQLMPEMFQVEEAFVIRFNGPSGLIKKCTYFLEAVQCVSDILNGCSRLFDDSHNASFRTVIPPIVVETSEQLTNYARFNALLASGDLPATSSSPSRWSTAMDSNLLELPKNPRHDWVPYASSSSGDFFSRRRFSKPAPHESLVICLKDNNRNPHRLPHGFARSTHDLEEVIDEAFTREQVNETASILADLYNKWPWGNITPTQKKVRNCLLRIARQKVVPNAPLSFNSVGSRRGYNLEFFELDIVFVDVTNILNDAEGNPQAKSHVSVYIPIPSINTKLSIPEIPSQHTFRRPENESFDEMTLTTQERQAYHVAQYVLFKLQDKIGTKDQISNWAERIIGHFTTTHRDTIGLYRNRAFYRVGLRDGATSIMPRKNLPKEVKEMLSDIVLSGASKRRLLNILQILNQIFFDTGDLERAWLRACQVADVLNENPEHQPLLCTCDEESEKTTLHLCTTCHAPTFCQQTIFDGDSHECDSCRELNAAQLNQQVAAPHALLEERSALISRLRGMHKRECDRLGLDEAFTSLEFQQICSRLQQDGTTALWRDAYTNLLRPDRCTINTRAGNPFAASADAVFPFSRRGRDELGLHTPDNIAITANFINRLKWTYVPAFLQLIKDFRSDTIHNEKAKWSRTAEAFWVSEFDKIYWSGVQWPMKQASRLKMIVNDQELQAITGQFRGLVCQSDTQTEPWRHLQIPFLSPHPGWKPNGHERIAKLVHSIECRFGRLLSRSHDDCPWPFARTTIPRNWDWWTCWSIFSERAVRMWLVCNSCWVQVDCTETIFLECIWQGCNKKNGGDLLGVPLLCCPRHPLNFSLGHKIHRQQLRTGWKRLPTSLADRDETLNNCLVESWPWNCSKANFPASNYDQMIKEIDEISISEDLYDPYHPTTVVQSPIAPTYEQDIGDEIESDWLEPDNENGMEKPSPNREASSSAATTASNHPPSPPSYIATAIGTAGQPIEIT
ncbi:uncharacterized protein KY384_006600 [Bacidia gigantensis]|uniref:uncharacterized protein n=1 Tax=Bacidia gigantensis TaxID=2732470 RepID=UPI001D044FFC|nr:uncharacterized protein KY384_006600 [Bacidia gigantensis]KAG8528911.1 hypothetical protein KY384_006600 [Bacidia gigantensis]